MRFTSITDKGSQDINQDYFARVCRNGIYCFVMADGGGMGGEEASKTVAQAIISEFEKEPMLTREKASDCVEAAKEALDDFIEKDDFYKEIYTAVAVVLIDGKKAVTAHIGDVRVYELSKGLVSSITNDHTEAVQKFEAGEIQFDEIRTYKKNKYTKIINSKYDFQPEINEFAVNAKTALLICTSGFWRKITEKEIEEALSTAQSSKEWLAAMLHIIEKKLGTECQNMTALAAIM